MCESETGRKSPMIKTARGWGGIIGKDGKPERKYIQTDPILTPVYKMIKAKSNKISECGCRFESEHSNAVILCEDCSKLQCHNLK